MSASDTAPAKRPRPLSPHLQVWRFSITMAMSILHRATGIALTLGTILVAVWLVAAAVGGDAYDGVSWFLGSWLGILMLMGWTLALFYHLFAGLRHLLWDVGYGFDLPTTDRLSYVVLALTGGATLLVWVIGFLVW